jgi:hypothetical protein
MIGGYGVVLIKQSRADSPPAVPKRNPSYNSKKLAKILARMLSDDEREASFRAASELLKKHNRDWHDLVEAIERADILADPVPDPGSCPRAKPARPKPPRFWSQEIFKFLVAQEIFEFKKPQPVLLGWGLLRGIGRLPPAGGSR